MLFTFHLLADYESVLRSLVADSRVEVGIVIFILIGLLIAWYQKRRYERRRERAFLVDLSLELQERSPDDTAREERPDPVQTTDNQ